MAEQNQISQKLLDMLHIIGRAFEHEADDTFLEHIRAYVADPVTGLTPEAQKYADHGAKKLASVLADYDKADDQKLWRDYLDASYAELFLGVGQEAYEPVESYYKSAEKVLFAKQFFEVKETMDLWDYMVPSDMEEPADHIAGEWLFYVYLLQRSMNPADERAELCGKAAAMFKQKHLDTWINDACTDLIDKDDMGFYTGICNLTRAAMAELA